jgi:hypothetical protein
VAKKRKDPREGAARIFCRYDGFPEDMMFDGKPMWMKYLREVDELLPALWGGLEQNALEKHWVTGPTQLCSLFPYPS